MHEMTAGPALDRATLTELAMELRRECARLERALDDGDAWSEHHELLRALQRMAEGTYGTCARCGRPIPLGRLQVMPATQHCVACGR